MKQVQISEELFQALVKYHLVGMEDYREEIEKGLESKLESMTRRQFYSTYKTAATEGEPGRGKTEISGQGGNAPGFSEIGFLCR